MGLVFVCAHPLIRTSHQVLCHAHGSSSVLVWPLFSTCADKLSASGLHKASGLAQSPRARDKTWCDSRVKAKSSSGAFHGGTPWDRPRSLLSWIRTESNSTGITEERGMGANLGSPSTFQDPGPAVEIVRSGGALTMCAYKRIKSNQKEALS